MRKTKFRAWDKEKRCFLSPEQLDSILFYELMNDDEFEWMQFTGLTDKHGKEIWEGDVILLKESKITRRGFVE